MKSKATDGLPTVPSLFEKEETNGTFVHQIGWDDEHREVKCDWRSQYLALNIDCRIDRGPDAFKLRFSGAGRIHLVSSSPDSAEGNLALIWWVPPTSEHQVSRLPTDISSLDLKRCELEDWTVQLTPYSRIDPETNVPSDTYLLPRTDSQFNVLHYSKGQFTLAVHREHPRPFLTVAVHSTLARVWEKNREAQKRLLLGDRDLLSCHR